MTIYHVVLLHAKQGVPDEKIKEFLDEVVALKDKCVRPDTKQPYIKSFIAGKDISIEGMQNGITHSAICVFENEQDRNYYAHEDPAHLAIVEKVKGMLGNELESIQVSDFSAGTF